MKQIAYMSNEQNLNKLELETRGMQRTCGILFCSYASSVKVFACRIRSALLKAEAKAALELNRREIQTSKASTRPMGTFS